MAPLVKPEFGPTLPEVLAPLPRWVRLALAVLAVLVALLGAWVLIGDGPGGGDTQVVVRGDDVTFNLAYGDRFERVDRPGDLLTLVHRRDDGLFVQSFAVEPLTLPPYRGVSSGRLPLYATFHARKLARTLPGFTLLEEGKTRINFVPGYELIFQYDQGDRTYYGRDVFLVPDVPGQREGVLLELRATPTSGTPNALATGNVGGLKTPFRSFRFGTEREGGAT